MPTLCRRSPPSGVQMTASPSRPEASETIEAAQKRLADVAADGRGVPDLERGQEGIRGDGERGCRRPARRVDRPRLGEGDERRDRAGRADAQPGIGDLEIGPAHRREVHQAGHGRAGARRTATCRRRAPSRPVRAPGRRGSARSGMTSTVFRSTARPPSRPSSVSRRVRVGRRARAKPRRPLPPTSAPRP